MCHTADSRDLRDSHAAQPLWGGVISRQSRARLVAIARQHGLLIIEDAAYAYLAEQRPPPLAALTPESTIYVSGLSKNVATGLRFGFVPYQRNSSKPSNAPSTRRPGTRRR